MPVFPMLVSLCKFVICDRDLIEIVSDIYVLQADKQAGVMGTIENPE